jgi:hypothetical protein
LRIFFGQRCFPKLLGNDVIIHKNFNIVGGALGDFDLAHAFQRVTGLASTSATSSTAAAGAALATHRACGLLAEAYPATRSAAARAVSFGVAPDSLDLALFFHEDLIEVADRLVQLFTELFGTFSITARKLPNAA